MKVKNVLNIGYMCMHMFQDYMPMCLQISMSVRRTMIVMKRMEYALTLLDLISVAVKWDTNSVALDSAAVVSQFVCLMISWVCIVYVLSGTTQYHPTDIDECAEDTDMCDPNAECTNTIGSYSCACTVGYTGNGTSCGMILDVHS